MRRLPAGTALALSQCVNVQKLSARILSFIALAAALAAFVWVLAVAASPSQASVGPRGAAIVPMIEWHTPMIREA